MERYLKIGIAALLVCAGLIGGYAYKAMREQKMASVKIPTTVTVGSTTLSILLAATPEDRQRGLSGRASLEKNQGMLFVFDAPGYWGFWMKEMHFPIDIIWLDAAARVVTVARDVSPSSYPEVLHSTKPAQYVLELVAGESRALGIVEGQQLQIEGVVMR